MRRRQFLKLSGVGAVTASAVPVIPLLADKGPKWRPDGAGSIARIGVLTPDFDPVPESEMWAMAPPGVSIHAARVNYVRGNAAAFAEPPNVDDAAGRLAELNLRVILSAFTSSSYALGFDADQLLRDRLEKRAQGVPVILTGQAAAEALRFLGTQKVALIHPPWFSDEINAKGREYFERQGFETVICTQMKPARRFTEVAPAEVYEWVKTNAPRQAEVIFLAGNGLRSVGAIAALEKHFRKPVLTANQVLFWAGLRLTGASSKVEDYGRVFKAGG